MLFHRTPSESIAYAQLERGFPPNMFVDTTSAMQSPVVQRRQAQLDLVNQLGKLAASRTEHFRVKLKPSYEPVDVSKPAREWLQRLRLVGPDLLMPSPGRILDPRLNLMMNIVRHHINLSNNPDELWERMHPDPWAWTAMMQGTIARLRNEAARPAFVNACGRAKAHQDTRAHVLTAYFKPLIQSVYDTLSQPYVMRLELSLPPQRPRTSEQAAGALYGSLRTWQEGVSRAYSKSIAADVWRLDCDDETGLYAHVLLVFNGPAQNELAGIQHRLIDDWHAIGQPGAYVVDCKGYNIHLQYRGRGINEPDDTLAHELKDAIVYFARTDAPYAWEFGPKVPMFGLGDCN